jgi:hypothetical protein
MSALQTLSKMPPARGRASERRVDVGLTAAEKRLANGGGRLPLGLLDLPPVGNVAEHEEGPDRAVGRPNRLPELNSRRAGDVGLLAMVNDQTAPVFGAGDPQLRLVARWEGLDRDIQPRPACHSSELES